MSAIVFEPLAPEPVTDLARMDVAVFFGFVAERAGARLPPRLAATLARDYGADLAATDRLRNRPVDVASLAAFEALFDADARLDRLASVEGAPLPPALDVVAPAPLHLVVDGIVRTVALDPPPPTPAALMADIRAAQLGLMVTRSDPGGLVLTRDPALGAGTLAVLPNARYGFPSTQRSEARTLPCPLGIAVRDFFAAGGARAVIVRMGDPLPYATDRAARQAALVRLLARAGVATASANDAHLALDQSPQDAQTPTAERYALSHLYGLDDATFVLVPDLCELVAAPPDFAPVPGRPAAPAPAFAECLPPVAQMPDSARSRFAAPVADMTGRELWQSAVARLVRFVRQEARDKIIVAAVPRLGPDAGRLDGPRSAFLQLAEPFVRTAASAGAPGGLSPADGVLAGHLAGAALEVGTFLSAAPRPLGTVLDIDHDASATGLFVCRIGSLPGAMRLSADVTTASDPAWRDGPVSRLMAMLLRQAREIGAPLVFEPNGPQLWSEAADAMRVLLDAAYAAGALAGTGEGDSYTVRCDATTNPPAEVDAGRLTCEVSVRPAVPTTRIVVRLPLGGGWSGGRGVPV